MASPEKSNRRKLTTILCADVKSYSHLMETDEVGTFETLREYREEMARLIGAHDGRIVNTWGDAVISEFTSVIEAVECAINFQEAIADRNRARPAENSMWFRVGINLGDVLIEADDLYGEGVNIAARLQAVADPGGITISRTVYDHLRDKRLSKRIVPVGMQHVKNVSEPVETYRIDIQSAPEDSYHDDDDLSVVAARIWPTAKRYYGEMTRSSTFLELKKWWLKRSLPVKVLLGILAFVMLQNLLTALSPLLVLGGFIAGAAVMWLAISRKNKKALRKTLSALADKSPANKNDTGG